MITSLKLAKLLDTNHRGLLVKIRKLSRENEIFKNNIKMSQYISLGNKVMPMVEFNMDSARYLLNNHRNTTRGMIGLLEIMDKMEDCEWNQYLKLKMKKLYL